MRHALVYGVLMAGLGFCAVAVSQTGSTDAGRVPAPSPSLTLSESADGGGLPKTAEQHHEEGVHLLRERRIQPAIAPLERAFALDDKSALFATDLGYAYLLADRLSDAEVAFKQGITLEPARPQAYGHLVDCVLREPNRWAKRAELLEILDLGIRSCVDRERRIKIEVARIRAERGFGQLERAREHIEEALRSHPSRPLEKQILDLKASLTEDDKARRSMRDWPEPDVTAKAHERFGQCEQLNGPHAKKDRLACLAELLEHFPAWRAPRRLRVQVLTEQGHYDEAVKELTTLSRLEPSEPLHYRQLGLLLAEHGGLLELERADEALRMAMALEPEWTDLTQARQRLASRRFDSLPLAKQAQIIAPVPSDKARRLYEEAESIIGEGPEGRANAQALLDQILRESPAFVEAAALSYSLSRRVPEKTVEALWHDGPRLFALYQECADVEPALPRSVLERWLNRAIDLGSIEGRLTRALNQKARGDKAGAERELANYLALLSNREEVESVQLLRKELLNKPKSGSELLREALLNARLRLQSDDLDGALRQLDAPCRSTLEPEQLLWLGIVYERQADVARALGCYGFGLDQTPLGEIRSRIARRFSRLLARADANWLTTPATSRLTELASVEPAANWALARRALQTAQVDSAKSLIARYLASAPSDDRFVPEAKAMRQRLLATDRLQVEQRQQRLRFGYGIASSTFVVLGLLVYLVWFRGVTVERAIRRRPRIFPELRRIVGHLRHDVLKHRTSALELLTQDPSMLPKLRSTLLEPIAVSVIVSEAYAQLRTAARAQGVTLRRLAREPVFGALVKDLRLVERSLGDLRHAPLIRKLDVRLRTLHHDRLNQLLSKGPRFQLDATAIQNWIASLEAEISGKGQHWVVPSLQMNDLNLPFPVDESALFQIFANLLRNAEAAAHQTASPKVLVRLLREVDFAGRSWVKLQIGDNAETPLTEVDLENRAADRGLGIVRETARDWQGRVVIQREAAPYCKILSAEFAT